MSGLSCDHFCCPVPSWLLVLVLQTRRDMRANTSSQELQQIVRVTGASSGAALGRGAAARARLLADPEIPPANNAVWNAVCTGKGQGTEGGHRAGIVDN